MNWLSRTTELLEMTWSEVLPGVSVAVKAALGGLAVACVLFVKLPAACSCDSCPREFRAVTHPALRWTGWFAKNIVGAVVVVFGILRSLPGVPGPEIVTILIGVVLLDFPGKRSWSAGS